LRLKINVKFKFIVQFYILPTKFRVMFYGNILRINLMIKFKLRFSISFNFKVLIYDSTFSSKDKVSD